MTGDHLQGLTVPFIHSEKKERKHDQDHAKSRGGRIDNAFEQKEKRDSDECRRTETNKLSFGKPEQDFALDFRQVLRDRYIRHYQASSKMLYVVSLTIDFRNI